MPIVAFGRHSAIPHHQPTSKKLKNDDIVLVDFGCRYRGYWSDMTRTFAVGSPSATFTHVQTIVKTAYRIGLKHARANRSNQAIDEAVHQFLVKQKHNTFMNHTTGHGIGLEVHETPSVSRLAPAFTLQPNTLITIEPGLYFPGQFGYRYENTIAITGSSPKSLTGS